MRGLTNFAILEHVVEGVTDLVQPLGHDLLLLQGHVDKILCT